MYFILKIFLKYLTFIQRWVSDVEQAASTTVVTSNGPNFVATHRRVHVTHDVIFPRVLPPSGQPLRVDQVQRLRHI